MDEQKKQAQLVGCLAILCAFLVGVGVSLFMLGVFLGSHVAH